VKRYKSISVLSSAALALAVFVTSAVYIPILGLKFVARLSDDPSAGDTAAWIFIFSLPVVVPLDFLISLALALFAFFLSRKWLRQ
jgi:hypothetical protein